MSERRPIVEFPDYEITDTGEVWRVVATSSGRRWKNKAVPYQLKPAIAARTGYPMVVLCHRNGRKKSCSVHRLVCEAFHGPANGRYALHNDGTRTNNCASNLRWSSQKENMADCVVHGTRRQGSDLSQAKLTEADVQWIRAYPKKWNMFSEMARRLKLTRGTIREAYLGITWSHVE